MCGCIVFHCCLHSFFFKQYPVGCLGCFEAFCFFKQCCSKWLYTWPIFHVCDFILINSQKWKCWSRGRCSYNLDRNCSVDPMTGGNRLHSYHPHVSVTVTHSSASTVFLETCSGFLCNPFSLFSSYRGQQNWLQLDHRVLDHDLPKKPGPTILYFSVR